MCSGFILQLILAEKYLAFEAQEDSVMPTAWLRHCFLLVLFWLSAFPSSPPEAQPPNVAVEAGVAGGPQTVASAPEEPVVLPGVVIEEIPKGSALEKAGLQVGDVTLSWERLPNPPTNPEGSSGKIDTPFDWMWLEIEQAPRGAVVIRGRRGEEPLELRVELGLWEAKMRPLLPRALEEIYLTGRAQMASGDVEAAIRTWRSLAVGVVKEGKKDFGAWVALRIGNAWGKTVEWAKAEEAYREAIEAAESQSAQVYTWSALGKAYERQADNESAEKAYISALKIRQEFNPVSLGMAGSLIDLGNLSRVQGKLDRAYDYDFRALQLSEKLAPESLLVSTCLNNLAGVAVARGDLDSAQNYLSRALRINQNLVPQNLREAASLNNLGAVAWERGQLDSAQEYHTQALKIREGLAPQSLEVASSLSNLGNVVRERGDLDRAYEYHRQAVRISQQLSPTGPEMANFLNNAGSVAWDRGELDLAQDYLSRALEIREKLARVSPEIASSLSNLGAVALARGDLDLAYRYFNRALQIQEELAPKSLLESFSLTNLGDVAWTRQALDEAQSYNIRALQIREQLAAGSLVVATSLDHLGDIARARGQLDRAQEYNSRALEIREQLAPQSRDMADSLNHMGAVAKARGDLALAHGLFLRALETLEHQISKLGGSYNMQAGFRSRRVAFYKDLLDLLFTQGHFDDAFKIVERFHAQTLLTMLAERDTAFTKDIPEELDRERRHVGTQYDRTLKSLAGLNPGDNREEIEATRRELRKLEEEAGDIEARIRQASPRLAALKYPHPLDTAEAQKALDQGTLLLSYSVGKEKTALFVLARSGDLEVKILPLGEKALRSQVKQLLSLIREAVQGSSLGDLRQRRAQAASRELYAALLGPVAEQIAASERLLILPDGPLHALPFAALVRDRANGTADSGQYLAEWKPIHVVLSATVFAELKQRRRPASESEYPIQLAAFGDPVYPQNLTKPKGVSEAARPTAVGVIAQVDVPRGDPTIRSAAERGVFDWPPLPYTRHEVEGIARLFPAGTTRTFLGPEALEERIKSLDPKTRILHLAAHGYTDEHLPSSSFVALTIPEDSNPDAAGPERDNGLLQVWEIFERVRLDADLVVLSACDTGLGEEQGGEGLIGLTRAFQYAGARTVMASLWSVQDQATSELMIRFYKHLRAGLTKDEALRQAQMELIREPIEVVNEKGEKTLLDASAPYFWAGFQVYGDWQ